LPEDLITPQDFCGPVTKWKKDVFDASTDHGIKLQLRNMRKTLPKCFNETAALSNSHNPNECNGEHQNNWAAIYHGAIDLNCLAASSISFSIVHLSEANFKPTAGQRTEPGNHANRTNKSKFSVRVFRVFRGHKFPTLCRPIIYVCFLAKMKVF
jgi:hypothetical protein